MSNITNINTQLFTRIAAQLTSHKRLPNPYRVERNPDTFLRLGYGVAYDAGNQPTVLESCGNKVERQVRIIITRRFAALDLDDADKKTTEVALFEDQQLLLADFEKYPFLGSALGVNDYAYRMVFVSDTGIQFVQPDEADGGAYLYLESIFTMEYSNPLT